MLREAFHFERQAADLAFSGTAVEPTRSVLHRSAATFALDCGEPTVADHLARRGLEGCPPSEIADELRLIIRSIERRQKPLATEETALLDGLIRAMNELLGAVSADFSDPKSRELAWKAFLDLTHDRLWPSVASISRDWPYRQQLAIQLKLAAQKVFPPTLNHDKVDAFRFCAERLGTETVTRNDISECRRVWLSAGVDPLPAFSGVLTSGVAYK
jgi:hypothetical protein